MGIRGGMELKKDRDRDRDRDRDVETCGRVEISLV